MHAQKSKLTSSKTFNHGQLGKLAPSQLTKNYN